jgi:hypothetical protein
MSQAKTIRLYFSTTSGEHDGRLERFRNTLAISTAPEFHFREATADPLSLHSDLEHQREEARIQARGYLLDTKAKRGAAMVLTLECPFGRDLDIDYAMSGNIAKSIFFNFQDELSAIPSGAIKTEDGYSIMKITPIEDKYRDGLLITLASEAGTKRIYMAWDETDALVSAVTRKGVSEAALLQAMRDYLVDTCGNRYLKKETSEITDVIRHKPRVYKGNPGINLKYRGSAYLPVRNIEVLEGNTWQAPVAA